MPYSPQPLDRCLLVVLGVALSVADAGAERVAGRHAIDWRKLAGMGLVNAPAEHRQAGVLAAGSDVGGALGAGPSSLTVDASFGAHRRGGRGKLPMPRGGGLDPEPREEEKEELPLVVAPGTSAVGGQVLKRELEGLIPSLRRRRLLNGWTLTGNILRALEAGRLEQIESPFKGETGVAYFAVLAGRARRLAIVIHYPEDEDRRPEEVRAIQNVLRNMQKTRPGILRQYAASETPESLGKNPSADVTLLVEPWTMTLRQYLQQEGLSARSKINAVAIILSNSAKALTNAANIAHLSMLDILLVTGDLDNRADRGRAVLAPSVMRIDSLLGDVPRELVQEDVETCAQLLKDILGKRRPSSLSERMGADVFAEYFNLLDNSPMVD